MEKGSENWTKEEERHFFINCDETAPGYYGVDSQGCSWYCAGGPVDVTATSFLKAQGDNKYVPWNAHNLNLKDAWVEGVPGYGIGEALIYTFDARAPRITKISVANGYVKTEGAWQANSRVKTLLLSINDAPYARLALEDSRSIQHFTVEPLGHYAALADGTIPEDGPNWTMRFTIEEVYKGTKYDDVVLSEIFFDGLDVHCLAAGTPILMADGISLPIEQVQVGMEVMGVQRGTDEHLPVAFGKAKVKALANPVHIHMAALSFADGNGLRITPDHPLLGADGFWYAVDAAAAQQGYPSLTVKPLAAGTRLQGVDGHRLVTAVQVLHERTQTYTIMALEGADAFVAGGQIVAVGQDISSTHKKLSE